MSSYTKSLMAMGIALIAVIFAAFWLRSQVIALHDLSKTRDDMKIQIAELQGYAVLIADFEQRLETLRRDIKQITGKFVGKDYETPRLVKAVVKSASLSGMEMINAFKLERKAGVSAAPIRVDQGQTVDVISHEIILKGSYQEFVEFLQSMAAWEMVAKIEPGMTVGEAAKANPWSESSDMTREDEQRFSSILARMPANPWVLSCTRNKYEWTLSSDFLMTDADLAKREKSPLEIHSERAEMVHGESSSYLGSAELVRADRLAAARA